MLLAFWSRAWAFCAGWSYQDRPCVSTWNDQLYKQTYSLLPIRQKFWSILIGSTIKYYLKKLSLNIAMLWFYPGFYKAIKLFWWSRHWEKPKRSLSPKLPFSRGRVVINCYSKQKFLLQIELVRVIAHHEAWACNWFNFTLATIPNPEWLIVLRCVWLTPPSRHTSLVHAYYDYL